MVNQAARSYAESSLPNLDLLEWFDETEREQCPACYERAMVGLEEAPEFRVCLGCAAVFVGNERVDKERRRRLLGLGEY